LKRLRSICSVLTTGSPFLKHVSTIIAWCCTLHYSMAATVTSVELANDMVPTISSSGVSNITHFKNHQVPLPHSIFTFCSHNMVYNKISSQKRTVLVHHAVTKLWWIEHRVQVQEMSSNKIWMQNSLPRWPLQRLTGKDSLIPPFENVTPVPRSLLK
jgi:hypothetical protein